MNSLKPHLNILSFPGKSVLIKAISYFEIHFMFLVSFLISKTRKFTLSSIKVFL